MVALVADEGMGITVSSTAAGEGAYLSDDPGDASPLIRQVLAGYPAKRVSQSSDCLSSAVSGSMHSAPRDRGFSRQFNGAVVEASDHQDRFDGH